MRQQEKLERAAATVDDSVFLRFDAAAELVPWKEINLIVSEGNYTKVTLADGRTTLVLRTLKEWIEMAPPDLLVRIHRTTVVRICAIEAITAIAPKQRELSLLGGHNVTVSRSYWTGVKSAILRWHPDASVCFP